MKDQRLRLGEKRKPNKLERQISIALIILIVVLAMLVPLFSSKSADSLLQDRGRMHQVGELAEDDVYATENFSYIDEKRTQALIQEKQRSVAPLFSFSLRSTMLSRQRIDLFIDLMGNGEGGAESFLAQTQLSDTGNVIERLRSFTESDRWFFLQALEETAEVILKQGLFSASDLAVIEAEGYDSYVLQNTVSMQDAKLLEPQLVSMVFTKENLATVLISWLDGYRKVQQAFQQALGMKLTTIDASERYFTALRGVTEPEKKRKTIGELFIRLFEEQAARVGNPPFLVQGTIYPDVVESSGTKFGKAERIKSHHNVGGLPSDMKFALVEPLRDLFKDEVRLIGEALGLPAALVWRQPFPGPGLAVRCLGEVTPPRIECLQNADDIFISELVAEGLINKKTAGENGLISQAFAALLPVKSVGVMGDQRTYQEVIALRAVTTEDFMTADWAQIPPQILSRVANRIVNEVKGVNRVVYDITSKPPATIEWE